ncbi:hypothetical protein HGP14_18300 [Rhizobium sp. P32RR-XVIII]|uniref:hypothetical protein n=1 Tax=Rhizobium sp. P32RR-XVIII TaxID=2726738 RepID=UPI0014569FB9|nr:hypothetical protein [Rhizobium sp. P32RR-XVIII]NLS05300.1 hypothetical protein [Rhizobium sp. P32RR-XVIII]
MSLDDFDFFPENFRSHMAYALCVAGAASVGLQVGRKSMNPLGVVALGAMGTVAGLYLCKPVSNYLKDKLFDPSARMSEREFRDLVRQVRTAYPHLSRAQIFDLVALAREEAARNPFKYRSKKRTSGS